MTSYQKTLEFLFTQLPVFQRQGATAYKKDLTNIKLLLAAIDNPHQALRTIHIAGSNGKGSVAHLLCSSFMEAGYQVGLYTSPHYLDFRERIKHNGQLIDEKTIVQFVDQNKSAIDEIKPSFFEITVALAFHYFFVQKVDIAIIETGLGGRLDSTNVIHPDLSIITNISMDHQQFLGDSLAEIALEKLGIVKKEVPCLIGRKQTEIELIFLEKTKQKKAQVYWAEELHPRLDKEEGTDWRKENERTAKAAIQILAKKWKVNTKHFDQGKKNLLQNTQFIGRWMNLRQQPFVLADSAHNEDGIAGLVNNIDLKKYGKVHILFGTVKEKPLDKIINLLPKGAVYHLVKPNVVRGLSATSLAKQMNNFKQLTVYESIRDALKVIDEQLHKNDALLVFGSIFLVADFLGHFKQ